MTKQKAVAKGKAAAPGKKSVRAKAAERAETGEKELETKLKGNKAGSGKKAEKIGAEKGGKKAAGAEKTVAEKKGKKSAAEKKEHEAKKRSAPIPASPEKKILEKAKAKIRAKMRPVFRGRFGKSAIRRKSMKKWDKWRKPRGIDIVRVKSRGLWPKTGYRTPKEIRGMHPSGLGIVAVHNPAELGKVGAGQAAVIASKVGRMKRIEIAKAAKKAGVRLLNAGTG